MAHIKCRYRDFICDCDGCEYCQKSMRECAEGYGSNFCNYFRGSSDLCEHVTGINCEFEKSYKVYEFRLEDEGPYPDRGWLSAGKITVDADLIEYLEIDGRVLIDRNRGER